MFSKHRNIFKLHYASYFLYFLSINAPAIVYSLKECKKVPGNVCKCKTDEGIIDLWSLAGTGSNVPRFKGIADKNGKSIAKVSWNPCKKWSVGHLSPPWNCEQIAVCYISDKAYVDVGEQQTADYSYNETTGTCVLSMTGKPVPNQGPTRLSTQIFLQCNPDEEGRLESLNGTITTAQEFKLFMRLHSKYACAKSHLSVGSILIIISVSLLVVYLVAGILFNKYSKGASGIELIPNVNFWIDFPVLVKDGMVFTCECCKRVCSRRESSYESIQ